jgi:hypothetical protein
MRLVIKNHISISHIIGYYEYYPRFSPKLELHMTHQELLRWRKKIGASAFGSYHMHQHHKAPPRPEYITPVTRFTGKRFLREPKGNYRRTHFTQNEIEAMWLAVCRVIDYVGGSRKLLSELTGISNHLLSRYIKKGRFTAEAAHVIGLMDDMPFSREELRPDIDQQGWADFDAFWISSIGHVKRIKMKEAHRIEY